MATSGRSSLCLRGQLAGDLAVRHGPGALEPLEHRRPALGLVAQQPRRLGGVGDRLVIQAGEYRWHTLASGSRSPFPASSWTHRSASGSSAAPQPSTRTAAVLPCPGLAPISQFTSNIGTLTGRSRGSVPNGITSNRSVCLALSSGHGGGFCLLMSCMPDPQVQAPRVLLGHASRPGRRQRAAQPGGQGLLAGQDVRGAHAVRQVQVTGPARPVAHHVGDEPDALAACRPCPASAPC